MILGVLFFLTANAASLLGARALLARIKTEESPLDLLLLLLLRILLVSAVVLVAGLTHSLTRERLGTLAVIALAGLLACGAHRNLRCPRPTPGLLLWLLTAGVVLRLALQVWYYSPHMGDAVAYHLPKIAEWIQAGRFTREMGLHPSATFPAGFELIETWWVVFLRHDVLIEAAGVEFLALAAVATFTLGRLIGLEERPAWLAALLLALTPGLYFSATSCMNDAPAAGVVLATAALVLGRAPLPLFLLTVGLGVGIKSTTAYALPGIAVLALGWRNSPSRPSLPSLPSFSSSRTAWALAGLGIAVGLFWYGRNLAWYGNPLYPIGAPGYEDSPVYVPVGPRGASFLANVLDLVNFRLYDQQTALGANVDDMAGWGPVIFACGLPALLIALLEVPLFRRLAAAFGVSLASCLLLSDHHPWTLKYVFFFPALPALAAAWLARQNRGFASALGIALACSALLTFLPYDLPLPKLRSLAAQGWRERSALPMPAPLEKEDVVACLGGYTARAYLLYRPDFSRRVVYLRPKDAGDFERQLRQSGARVVYFNPADGVQQDILSAQLMRGTLVEVEGPFYAVR